MNDQVDKVAAQLQEVDELKKGVGSFVYTGCVDSFLEKPYRIKNSTKQAVDIIIGTMMGNSLMPSGSLRVANF